MRGMLLRLRCILARGGAACWPAAGKLPRSCLAQPAYPRHRNFLILGVVFCAILLSAPQLTLAQNIDLTAANRMPIYQTAYYIIHTDLPADQAREAAIRMTKMAEEYHNRTKDFSGTIRQKLPFYLFRHVDDYLATGVPAGTAGLFTGLELLAVAGDHPTTDTWHTVQHEGFHQFAKAVIGGEMPIWMNEGLAEYFGEALFTGDGFQSGIIPPARMKRILQQIQLAPADGGFRNVVDLMAVSHAQWNQEMSLANYDQAWSMVQFLAHGDNGKYQSAFVKFMKEISRGMDSSQAWRDAFGDTQGFQERWQDFWKNLPPNPADQLYAQANVATLTSFLARALAQKQTFATFDDFLAQADSNQLTISDKDWLPAALLDNAAKELHKRQTSGAKYDFVAQSAAARARGPAKNPQIVMTLPDGTQLIGKYTYASTGKVAQVTVDVVAPKTNAARGRGK